MVRQFRQPSASASCRQHFAPLLVRLTRVRLRLPMVVLVLRPAAPEALRRAVVAQVLRDLGAQADGALDRGLLLGVHAADGAAAGDGAAEPAGAQLPGAGAGGLAFRGQVLRGLHRLAALQQNIRLERDGGYRSVTRRQAHADDRYHLWGVRVCWMGSGRYELLMVCEVRQADRGHLARAPLMPK